MKALLHRTIPATGEQIPALGIGTYRAYDIEHTNPRWTAAATCVADFVAAGGAVIDCSPMYGRAETAIGELATEFRPRLFVASKVWCTGRAAGHKQIETSFQRLRSERLDLMQVHNLLDVDVHQETLSDLKRQGRIRYVGVTHYHAGAHVHLEQVLRAGRYDFVQVNYSLGELEAETRLLPCAQDLGTAVIANRPFMQEALLRRLHHRPLPPGAAELGCVTWAQALLKFVLAHPAVTCVIPATGNPQHLAELIAAACGPLPDANLCARWRVAIRDW